MITIIDLGLSNINSVRRALTYLNYQSRISRDVVDIETAEILILPGVGSFFEASKRLFAKGIADVIKKQVLNKKVPFLGICLGMQLIANDSEENGFSQGLGFVDANVKLLESDRMGLRLPHVGWNDISETNMALFKKTDDELCYYFVHSYAMQLNEDVECAKCNYGIDFVAAVKKDNVIGVQFHPEKSQRPGLQILKNFVEGDY
jgi:glutamine amidotransferase